MKTRPPAVTIGPPRFGEPQSGGIVSLPAPPTSAAIDPSGTSQRRPPVLRLDRHQRAERRRRARQPRRRQQQAPPHDVGRAPHHVVLVVVAEPLLVGPRASARSKPSRGMSCTIAAIRFTGTTAICRTGSTATPPQCAPPMFDGHHQRALRLGGVKMPSLRSAGNRGAARGAIRVA